MASSRSIGNGREYRTVALLRKLGYVANRTARSGKRTSASAKESGFAGDIVALARFGTDSPNLTIEVGGKSKRVASSLAELDAMNLRDVVSVVCRYLKPAGKTNSKAHWYVRGSDGKPIKTGAPGSDEFLRDVLVLPSTRLY